MQSPPKLPSVRVTAAHFIAEDQRPRMSHLMKNQRKRYHNQQGHFLAGKGASFQSYNPVNLEVIWDGRIATPEEIEETVHRAHLALNAWSLLEVKERAVYLQNFALQIKKRHAELSTLIALETGKPFWEAETEANAVISKVAYAIQAYHERTHEKTIKQGNLENTVRYKPHGVVVVLGAFNFPAHLSNGHIVPALLAGNTVIYKPSELTPAVGEFMVQCWHDSGLPPGVLNIVQGDAQTAKTLFTHDIQGVYFTGSYRAGVAINQFFSSRPEVILALEMGGNNPLVIGEIEHIQPAVYNTILSSFLTAGQRCTCARRLMVPQTSQGDNFLEALIKATQEIRIGAPHDDPAPFMGPVIRAEHAKNHLLAQATLAKLGGVSLLKMEQFDEPSAFLTPGIMDMTSVNNPPDEEIFAPFIQVYRYTDFEQALSLANQTRYGLAAGLFSDSIKQYQQFYSTVRAGLINWNRPTTGASSELPFGGVGYSGNHRPSAYFAADYCAYPIASIEEEQLKMPAQILPGLTP